MASARAGGTIKPNDQPPSWTSALGALLACVGVIAGTGWLAVVANSTLPTPLGSDAPPEVFSEERALSLLRKIVDIGLRPVGSPAVAVTAPSWFMRELEDIRKTLAATTQAGVEHPISLDFEVQKSEGSWLNGLLEWEFTSVYANNTNVIAKLSPEGSKEKGLLIVSHYDTAVGSLGAMDDGMANAVMLETLRALVSDRQFLSALKAPLIFLWNGGEEPILTGAHGFLSHPWMESVAGFINLESSGWGGREMLYQASPHSGGLIEQFAESSRYPLGHSFAQDLFSSGLIPADTDFRIFKDEAGLPGLDLAFYQHGYVYHTFRDDLDHVVDGAAQNMGENVLGFVKLVGKEGLRQSPHQSTIWFDILNRVLLVFAKKTMASINYSIAAIAAALIVQSASSLVPAIQLLSFASVYVAGLVLCLLLPCTAAIILINRQVIPPLIWYSRPLLAYALYTPFCIVGLTLPTVLMGPVSRRKTVYLNAQRAILFLNAAVLLALTFVGLDSSYVYTFITLSAVVQLLLTHSSSATTSLGASAIRALLVASAVLALVPGSLFIGLVFAFWVPNTGKMGEKMIPGVGYATPDVITAGVFALLTLVTFHSIILPIVELLKAKAGRMRTLLGVLGVAIGVALVSIGAARSTARPFTFDAPKRVILQKTTWLDTLAQAGSEAGETFFSSQPIEQAWVATGLELSMMTETLSELCRIARNSSTSTPVDQAQQGLASGCGARLYSAGPKTPPAPLDGPVNQSIDCAL